MRSAEAVLLARARRAYERGRLALGVKTASAVVPMALISWFACDHREATLLASAAAILVVTAAVWHGGGVGRGARLGLIAGAPALLLPVLVAAAGHACGAEVCLLYPVACLGGGLMAGVVLAMRGLRSALGLPGLASAGVTAGLVGSLGCIVAGAAGLAVLVIGLVGGFAPVVAVRSA